MLKSGNFAFEFCWTLFVCSAFIFFIAIIKSHNKISYQSIIGWNRIKWKKIRLRLTQLKIRVLWNILNTTKSKYSVSLFLYHSISQIKTYCMFTYLTKLVIFCNSLFQLLKINIKKEKKNIQYPTTHPHCYRDRFTATNTCRQN